MYISHRTVFAFLYKYCVIVVSFCHLCTNVTNTVKEYFDSFADQGISFTAFDMSGAGRYRNLWEHHFKACQGIVFVIDSSDRMRLGAIFS